MFNCSEGTSDEKIIDTFINEVIIKKNLDYDNWSNYINFPDNQSKEGKKIIIDLIKQNIIRTNLVLENNEYTIIKYSDLEKNNLSSNLKYNDYDKLYFLISDNKIINPFIIENNKIIAFFNGLTKQRRNSYPLILNKDNIF